MRIALLQLNQIVGDLEGNADRIEKGVVQAHAHRVDIIITPELSLIGYLPKDLLLSEDFVLRSFDVLERLALRLKSSPPVLVGIASRNPRREGRPLHNSAALVHQGKVQQLFHKALLPTYDVFDEDRYFEPASEPQILKLSDGTYGISICEDIWNDKDFWNQQRYHSDPIDDLRRNGAQCILNMSASPFTAGKQKLRESMLSALAKKHRVPVIYVNLVGGNDDLVFDGRSCAFNAKGELLSKAKAFQEDLIIIDTKNETDRPPGESSSPESEIWNALVTGTRDYVRKCGFSKVVLGLSGGIDSALTAAVAAEAVGSENVMGLLMPSPYSSKGSLDDSHELVRRLRIQSATLAIEQIMGEYTQTLSDVFQKYAPDVTEENIQARIRGNLLMAMSNKLHALLLTTGNKSELSVGYCTLYGDMSGGLAVISDVPKTMVYRLARWYNTNHPDAAIPEPILTKAPSAELKPDQTDQDSLPDYDTLDKILELHIEQHKSVDRIVQMGFDAETVRKVIRLVKNAEFKRKQAAPGIKVTDRAFGTGWRMPIASRQW